MDDELEQLLADLEDDVAAEVRAVLDEVADEFAEGLNSATEIVAARFSVSSIARSWASRMPRLVRRLLRVSETAAARAATDVDGTLPDGWTDLPARYDDDTLPPQLGDYVTATEHLLRAVGERLAAVATRELAAGLNAGEGIDQLRARLRAAFDREGAQLGDVREERIARTESVRAWNAATLAAAQALSGPDRPLVKQWRTRGDDRVRHSHADVNGFVRLLDDPFSVGGTDMQYPGDPTAPADQTVNCRCVLVLANADRTAAAATGPEETPMDDDETPTDTPPPVRAWSTPDATALAFENQETGDGRIFAPGALQWANGPWPLMYADKNLGGHDGSELAGAIQTMGRDGDRVTGSGVLYLTTDAGWEAEQLLQQGAPLGVSVDLDDVDIEFVDRTTDTEEAEAVTASFATASVLRLADGTYHVQAHTAPKWDAAGTSLVASSHTVDLYTGTDGTVSAAAVHAVLPIPVTAAAGDPDSAEHGTVVHTESSGDLLVRITRARVRGATLVSVPAFADARIVLDPEPAPAPADDAYALAAAATTTRDKVITYVRTSPSPVTAREIADRFDLTLDAARAHLTAAVESGHLVRIARGQYVAATDLPEGDLAAADSDTTWDEETMSDLEASAWTAMRDLPPMPAEWFQDPTDLLPDGAPGVNFRDGRIFGWVARAGEPHAGYPGKKLTIESLGKIDTSHFLRQRFTLDDGSTIKAGAFTMNVGHHRDGAECETASCQFDDTRTVAGIVTVGMNKRGLWFSGAAAPWLSTWDQQVFMASQPSYHMKQARGGWQLRAVLSVPVPGHSTPLVAAMATAVERSNLALTAAAALAEPETEAQPEAEDETSTAAPTLTEAISAALTSPQFLDSFADALQRREAERAAELAALTADITSIRDEITASAAPTDKEN